MDWSAVEASPEKIALAQRAVETIPHYGVSVRALSAASHQAFGDADRWRLIFPGGLTETLWFISEVSDQSMAGAFASAAAQSLPEIVLVRFSQNAELKAFVSRVMIYDFLHPFQALSRMQRTATAMFACVGESRPPSFARLTILNLLYTFTVMIWLADRSRGNRMTGSCTRMLLGWL